MCHFFDLLTKCASTSLNCAFCMWWQRSYIIGMIYSLWRFLFCLKHKLESRGKWKCAFRVASLLLPAGGKKKKSFLSGCSVCPPFISLELNGFGLFSKQEIPHAAKISVKLQPSRCQISLYLHPVWRIRFFFWHSHPILSFKLHFSLTLNFPHVTCGVEKIGSVLVRLCISTAHAKIRAGSVLKRHCS